MWLLIHAGINLNHVNKRDYSAECQDMLPRPRLVCQVYITKPTEAWVEYPSILYTYIKLFNSIHFQWLSPLWVGWVSCNWRIGLLPATIVSVIRLKLQQKAIKAPQHPFLESHTLRINWADFTGKIVLKLTKRVIECTKSITISELSIQKLREWGIFFFTVGTLSALYYRTRSNASRPRAASSQQNIWCIQIWKLCEII